MGIRQIDPGPSLIALAACAENGFAPFPLPPTAKPTLAVLLRLAWPCHPFFGAVVRASRERELCRSRPPGPGGAPSPDYPDIGSRVFSAHAARLDLSTFRGQSARWLWVARPNKPCELESYRFGREC